MRAIIITLLVLSLLFMTFNYIASSQLNATEETEAMFDVVMSVMNVLVYVLVGVFLVWVILRWVVG